MSRALLLIGVAGCGFSIGGGEAPIDASADAAVTIDALDAPSDPDPCFVVEVAASSAHNCARMQNGDVWCWGKNGQGEVGRPPQASCATACNPTAEKIDAPPAVRLGLGDQHSCILTATETYCMGANDSGQFGNTNAGDSSVPVAIAQRAGARALVAGNTHTCSLHDDRVLCSGANGKHEVGDGTTTPHYTPHVTVPSGAHAIGTGFEHACMVDGGFVYCWGSNAGKQINAGTTDVTTPTIIAGIGNAVAVAAGYAHTCAVLGDGSVRCWGANNAGQLGTGDILPQTTHVMPQVSGIVAITAGSDHTCALASGGTVYCWGEGYLPSPSAITLQEPAVSIASGSYHDCFALSDGTAWCVNTNSYGQLGDGTITPSAQPVRVGLCP